MSFPQFVKTHLAEEIPKMPDEFYDTFKYTSHGSNLTHPLTIGILARCLSRHPRVVHVGVDVRLGKFSPDIVAYDEKIRPLVLIDYESPNSSDMRIRKKDVSAYRRWSKHSGTDVPYIVITTLPDYESKKWQLRYTKELNASVKSANARVELRKNPEAFWYQIYKSRIPADERKNIHFLNISGKNIKIVNFG